MSQINLDSQVGNGPLALQYGGTANVEGKAEGMYRRYFNRDAGVLSLGTLVSFRDATESGSIAVQKTTGVDDPDVLGVVVGTFTIYGPDNGKFEFSAPSNDMEVAVLQYGRTSLLSIGSNGGVTRGMYAYSVGSNGQVYGDTRLHRGAIGRFLSNGSNGTTGSMCEIGRPFDTAPYGQFVSANVVLDGGGALITTGQKVRLFFDWAGVIDGWTAIADTDGSCSIELWKDTYASYPPNSADSMNPSVPISISSNTRKNFSDSLTGWASTSIAKGDAITVNLNTVQNFTNMTVNLRIRRST